MNPAQLLNPKAFAKEKAAQKRAPNYGPKQSRKPQPSASNGAPSNSATAFGNRFGRPISVHGNSSSGSMAGDDQPNFMNGGDTEMNNGGDNEFGFSSFVDKIHNTTEREAVNYRKHPLQNSTNDEDEENKKSKTTFTGGAAGSGIIGEHLKGERKKAAAEAGPEAFAAPIDLTQDNDEDEVVFVGQKRDRREDAEREICIGTLRCQGNASRVPNQKVILNENWWSAMRVNVLRIKSSNNVIEFQDRTNKTFARLEFQSAAALAPLMDGAAINKIRVKGYLEPRPRVKGEVPGSAISQRMSFRLTIYCPRVKADQIGRYLSQKQLFLDTPTQVDAGREVYNPHNPQAYRGRPIDAPARPAGPASVTYVRTAEESRREVTTMFDGLPKNEDLPEKEANSDIILTPLMPHQKKALQFLIDHETHDETVEGSGGNQDSKFSLWKEQIHGNGKKIWHNVITGHEETEMPVPVYGGILADMMGLGKTLSILSLVAATVDDSESFRTKRPSAEVLEPGLVERNAKGTLIVCPKSVLSNWSEQIGAHVHFGKLSTYVYHGSSRTQDLRELSRYDIVLTSYGTVANEVSGALKKRGALVCLQWFRIVLDEAHMIRNANTRASKGTCAVAAQRRWAVTGTPIQNSLNDLGALIRFLRVKPFDEKNNWVQYIISPFKNGDVEILPQLKLLVAGITLRREKDNIGLVGRVEKTARLEFTFDERKLYSRFAGQSNLQLKSMMRETNTLRGKSYAHVLKSLLRLRMICDHGREMLNEEDLKDLEGMDPSNAIELGDEPGLDLEHRFISNKAAYELLHIQSQNDLDVCQRCSKHVLGNRSAANDDADDTSSSEDESEDAIGALTPCYHVFCTGCKKQLLRDVQPPNLRPDGYHECPICSAYVPFDFFDLSRSGYQTYLDEHTNQGKKPKRATWTPDSYSGPHTKVRALLEALDTSALETAALPTGEPPIRSVVFSEWTSYLDLIEYALDTKSIGYVRLDGKMNVKQRTAAIAQFRSDPAITVMIVSIRAGGQGLNFTAANKVYMMEPQFNPGVEQQAIDRVHRLGQKRDVEIVHFIMHESVEDALVKLQEKKTKLANLSMEKKMTRTEEARARMEELRDLFK